MKIYQLVNKFIFFWNYFKTQIYYQFLFKEIRAKSVLFTPMRLMNPSSISIGNKTIIEKEATLYSIDQFANKRYNGKIFIGNNVYINHHFNVTCANCVDIKDDVLIAYNVSIFDFDHDYEDINSNINKTDLIVKGPIIIGEKSWIGMNVAILGKVTIGKHCIIGANSVVIKDIPDYSIAVGNPARVIKSFNLETSKWEKVAEL